MEGACYLTLLPRELFDLIDGHLDEHTRLLLAFTSPTLAARIRTPLAKVRMRDIYYTSAREGALSLLQWAARASSECRAVRALGLALRHGHSHVAEHLLESVCTLTVRPSHVAGALVSGSVACLDWLRSRNVIWPDTALLHSYAAQSGHLEALLWAEKHLLTSFTRHEALRGAIKSGNIDVAAYVCSGRSTASRDDLLFACKRGNIKVVEFMESMAEASGKDVLIAAIESRNYAVFYWAWCQYDRIVTVSLLKAAASFYYGPIVKTLLAHVTDSVLLPCASALLKGAVHCDNREVIATIVPRIPRTSPYFTMLPNLMAMAVHVDNEALYSWLCEQGALNQISVWSDAVIAVAAQHGRLRFLDREIRPRQRTTQIAQTISIALPFNRADVIEWLAGSGFALQNLPYYLLIMRDAARRVDLLRLLARAGATFAPRACVILRHYFPQRMLTKDNVEFLKFLRDDIHAELPQSALIFLDEAEKASMARKVREARLREKRKH